MLAQPIPVGIEAYAKVLRNITLGEDSDMRLERTRPALSC